jgi:hypothetical protein
MLSVIVTHAIALTLGLAGGYYLHYKFGAAVAADVTKIRSVV